MKTIDIDELAIQLANLALGLDGLDAGRDEAIHEVSKSIGVDARKCEREYVGLRVYMLEMVIGSVEGELSNVDASLFGAFRSHIDRLASKVGLGDNFWIEQDSRSEIYDVAWDDPRGVGQGTAMAAAFASQLLHEDLLIDVLPLWFKCSSVAVETLRFLKSLSA